MLHLYFVKEGKRNEERRRISENTNTHSLSPSKHTHNPPFSYPKTTKTHIHRHTTTTHKLPSPPPKPTQNTRTYTLGIVKIHKDQKLITHDQLIPGSKMNIIPRAECTTGRHQVLLRPNEVYR